MASNGGGGLDVTKESLVGSWRVNGSCDMFLTLTNLGSGSRGGTRGCVGELTAMGSWEVAASRFCSRTQRQPDRQRLQDRRQCLQRPDQHRASRSPSADKRAGGSLRRSFPGGFLHATDARLQLERQRTIEVADGFGFAAARRCPDACGQVPRSGAVGAEAEASGGEVERARLAVRRQEEAVRDRSRASTSTAASGAARRC
jgi:hypothetical protein